MKAAAAGFASMLWGAAVLAGCAHGPSPGGPGEFGTLLARELGPLHIRPAMPAGMTDPVQVRKAMRDASFPGVRPPAGTEDGFPPGAGTEDGSRSKMGAAEAVPEAPHGTPLPPLRGVPGEGPARGPAETRYREYFGIDDVCRRTGIHHRMGMLADGEPALGVQYFIPPGRRKGTVFLAHGYLDHSGRLLPLIEAASGAGFSVIAFDLPGHGFSGGSRGEIGGFDEYGAAAGRVVGAFSGAAGDGGGSAGEGAAGDGGAAPGGAGGDGMGVHEVGGPPLFPRPWIAAGHSAGAASFFIYLHSLARDGRPSPFDRVVFINPLVRSARWHLSMLGLRLIGGLVGSLKPLTEQDSLLGVDVFPMSWARRLRDWNRRVLHYRPFSQPGLLIQGLEDRVVDFRHNLPFLAGKMPDLNVSVVEGADHVPYTGNEANREILRLFVQGLEGSP